MTEPDTRLAEIADLDDDRLARRGYPEAVYCAGKTPEQLRVIAAGVRDLAQVTLFTRADDHHAAAVRAALPDARWDADAGLLAWPPEPPDPTGGLVVIVAAGTSDLRVAREATITTRPPVGSGGVGGQASSPASASHRASGNASRTAAA